MIPVSNILIIMAHLIFLVTLQFIMLWYYINVSLRVLRKGKWKQKIIASTCSTTFSYDTTLIVIFIVSNKMLYTMLWNVSLLTTHNWLDIINQDYYILHQNLMIGFKVQLLTATIIMKDWNNSDREIYIYNVDVDWTYCNIRNRNRMKSSSMDQ